MSHVLKLKDDEPVPAGHVLAVRKDGPQAGRYAVQPRAACAACHGRGVVFTTKARVKPAAGPLEAVTERVEQLCGCVGGRLYRALDAGGSGTLGGPPPAEPMITPPDPAARLARRLRRLREELAVAELALERVIAARDRATAPHLLRAAVAEAQATTLRADEVAAQAAAAAATALLRTAAEALADATERHEWAATQAAAADVALQAARDAVAPLAAEVEAAQQAATAAANRGHRHRIEVAQARLAELRARLARVVAEAPAQPDAETLP